MNKQQKPNYTFALAVVIVVIFMLGFITTMNNSMIDFFKQTFDLSGSQGQYVNTAFFGAYILSIPLALLMNRIGYKMTLVLGLMVIALGFFLNYIGIGVLGETGAIYGVYLACMFCVAIGIVLLQLVINPYVMALGDPEKGAFRMTMSQTFNSLATTIAPLFVSMLIVSGSAGYSINSIKMPFIGLGAFTLLLGVILYFIKLPTIKEGEQEFDKGKEYKSSVFSYPHVWLCGLAIFMYMGVEIGIPSLLPAKIRSLIDAGTVAANVDPTTFLPYYWGGMLVGRALGTVLLARINPRLLLISCLSLGAFFVALSFVLPGIYSVYALIVTGLFHSVMWPLIFNLGLADLGPHTKAASGVINTGVIGAAVLMPLMGVVVDKVGLLIAIACLFIYYGYIIWFAVKGSKIRTA